MKLRNLVITVAILAVLSALAYLGNRPAPAASDDPRVGKPLLDSDTAARAAGLAISDQGKKVELVRSPEGAWRVPGYFDMPADFEKIARFVQDLNEAKVDRFVTASPERIARLEFKDSAVTLRDSAGKEIWAITLGKTPDSGNGRFVRFGQEPKAFLSGLHAWLDTDPKSWADTRLVAVKSEDIAKVEVSFEDGASLVVSRAKKDSAWSAPQAPVGKKLIEEKISSLVGTLTSLRFTDTTDTGDAAALEAARHPRAFTLTTFSGTTLKVALGRKPEEKKLKAPAVDPNQPLLTPKDATAKPETTPITPEFETVPAGPVFVSVASSEAKATINALMAKRAFKVDDYSFTALPQKLDELLEPEKAK